MHHIMLLVMWLLCYCQFRSFVNANSGDCNEFVCGSVVSKCLLTQSCQCKRSDCKDCLHCLGALYLDCCTCVDMCPKHNETFNELMPKSSIGDFEGLPELFDTLTADEYEDDWTTLRIPMRAGLQQRRYELPANGGGFFGGFDAIDHQAAVQKMPWSGVNCTIIFLNECTNNQKCMEFCKSMGASSFRSFHDGCCECVGANCFNYGINESRCAACPGTEEDDELEDAFNEDEDYNEDEMNYN